MKLQRYIFSGRTTSAIPAGASDLAFSNAAISATPLPPDQELWIYNGSFLLTADSLLVSSLDAQLQLALYDGASLALSSQVLARQPAISSLSASAARSDFRSKPIVKVGARRTRIVGNFPAAGAGQIAQYLFYFTADLANSDAVAHNVSVDYFVEYAIRNLEAGE